MSILLNFFCSLCLLSIGYSRGVMTESYDCLVKCDIKLRTWIFMFLFTVSFENTIVYSCIDIIGSWWSQWGVMAASHCHSWWRCRPAFVSNAHKVLFILILLVFCSGLAGIEKTFCPLYTFVLFLSAINIETDGNFLTVFWLKHR